MEIFALEIVAFLLVAFLLGCFAGHLLHGLLAHRFSPPLPAGLAQDAATNTKSVKQPVTRRSRRRRKRDDLTRIKGIGPTIEKKLNRMGIRRFEQIADWDLADVAVIDQRLAFKGRIERESWVRQARKLADAKN